MDIESLAAQAVDNIELVIASPLWKLLFLGNPGFASDLPAPLKLELIRYLHRQWGDWSIPDEVLQEDDDGEFNEDSLLEILSEVDLDVDPWETSRTTVSYSGDKAGLRHSIELGSGWSARFVFEDADLDMRDVNGGCDQRLCLAGLLDIYFEDPDKDLRKAAIECGVEYEPAMSPEGGGYFRLSSLDFARENVPTLILDAGEEVASNFNDSKELTSRLNATENPVLTVAELKERSAGKLHIYPLFEAGPSVVNPDCLTSCGDFYWDSESGVIDVSWKSGYWLPVVSPQGLSELRDDAELLFERKELEVLFRAYGQAAFEYTINYQHQCVSDLSELLLDAFDRPALRRLEHLYLLALGLVQRLP